MKRFFLILLLAGIAVQVAQAQIRVYGTDGYNFTDLVLRLDNGRTLPPFSYSINDAFYTVAGNKIMEGPMGSEFDLLYTFREGKLYSGHAMYTSQIRYTMVEGRIYRGDSVFPLDQLYNVRDGVIYNGMNSFPTDAIYFVEGQFSVTQLFAILLSLGLIS